MNGANTYLNFDGNCRAAMTFYKKCLGGELHITQFSEGPPECAQAPPDGILHASLTAGPVVVMASDIMPGMPFNPGNNFAISINCASRDEIERLFQAFSEGGEVTMPLGDMFWGARFGMIKDPFGVHWMFNYALPKQA